MMLKNMTLNQEGKINGLFKSVLIDAVLFIALAGLFAQTGMFYVSSVGVALLASLVLAVLNALVKPFCC